MEAYLFNIVFQIPVPIRNQEVVNFKLHKKDGFPQKPLTMSQPAILELPYANNSFFELLLDKLKPDDIITIFTVMLLEKKVLLIAPKEE